MTGQPMMLREEGSADEANWIAPASSQTLDVSAMPTGLESQISQQDMADLLAYIRQTD